MSTKVKQGLLNMACFGIQCETLTSCWFQAASNALSATRTQTCRNLPQIKTILEAPTKREKCTWMMGTNKKSPCKRLTIESNFMWVISEEFTTSLPSKTHDCCGF